MKRSTDRILTTHTGSLPRPPDLVTTLEGHDQRDSRANPAFDPMVTRAVGDIVRKQTDTGIDIVNDGERSKRGFSVYITERVTGFDGPPRRKPALIETKMFPEYYSSIAEPEEVATCNGPIKWCGDEFVKRDIENFKAAL